MSLNINQRRREELLKLLGLKIRIDLKHHFDAFESLNGLCEHKKKEKDICKETKGPCKINICPFTKLGVATK